RPRAPPVPTGRSAPAGAPPSAACGPEVAAAPAPLAAALAADASPGRARLTGGPESGAGLRIGFLGRRSGRATVRSPMADAGSGPLFPFVENPASWFTRSTTYARWDSA